MRKTIMLLLLAPGLLAGSVLSTSAQKFEGIATYKSSMNLESFNIAGEGMTPEMQESLRKQLAQQSQRDFTLTFNLQESLWEEQAELEPVSQTGSTGGVEIRMAGGNSKTYMNPSNNESIEETEIFGKKFLIVDEPEPYNWKITKETKKIGNYTVVKAEYQSIFETTAITLDNSEQKTETVMDTTQIIAWYTPDIPVSQGPANTWGLPGLILELQTGNLSYLCTKIELNPAEAVVIEKPNKGKRVSREEAEQIRDEKLQEMMKKFDTGEGGETRVIRIGG